MKKIKEILNKFKTFIIGFINKIQHDKKLHLIAGVIITIITLIITDSLFLGLLMGFFAGIIKEFIDSNGKGCVDFNDFTATVTGSAFIILILLLI